MKPYHAAETPVKTHLSVLTTLQLTSSSGTWIWLVSASSSGWPSRSHKTSGGSSSSPPRPFKLHCILTGLPSEEITVMGLCSNSSAARGVQERQRQDDKGMSRMDQDLIALIWR